MYADVVKDLVPSPASWLEDVCSSGRQLLADHALCERKASSMALTFVAHYPDKHDLVHGMIALAREELQHFHECYLWMHKLDIPIPKDEKDDYVQYFLKHIRRDPQNYLLDRMLMAGLIEQRGTERFLIIADAFRNGLFEDFKDDRDTALELGQFYQDLADAEARHGSLFHRLALKYYPEDEVNERYEQMWQFEHKAMLQAPHCGRLH